MKKAEKPVEKNLSDKPIEQRISEKRDALLSIHAGIAVLLTKPATRATASKIEELQHRLEFRTLNYEEQLLDEKIKIYREVADILRKAASKTSFE